MLHQPHRKANEDFVTERKYMFCKEKKGASRNENVTKNGWSGFIPYGYNAIEVK